MTITAPAPVAQDHDLIEDIAQYGLDHAADTAPEALEVLDACGWTPPANFAALWGKLLELLDRRANTRDAGPAWDEHGVDHDQEIEDTITALHGKPAGQPIM